MITKNITVEAVNDEAKLVVKRVAKSDGIYLGRQMPITNSLFYAERERKKYGLPLLESPIQTHHIHAHRKAKYWIYDDLEEAQHHAKESSRLFLPYQQRSIPEWAALGWPAAEDDAVELANKGIQHIPYSIPESATLQQVEKRFEVVKSVLSGAQEIIPIISADHDILNFRILVGNLLGKYKFLGVHVMSPSTHANARANLIDLWEINASITPGEQTSLVFGFNNEKHYGSTKVSGSFVCARHGIDIPSQRQVHPDQMKGMMKARKEQGEPDDDYVYDDGEGGFNKSEQQIAWYGKNRTLRLLSEISLAERLERYQAIGWSNFRGQQKDFDALTQAILEKGQLQKLIESKSRWYTYLQESSGMGAS